MLFRSQAYKAVGDRADQGPFKYQQSLSNKNTAVYIDPKSKKIHIAHRGSVELKEDWLKSDALIGLGAESADSRMKDALKLYKQLHTKYPNFVIEGSGHSLGGGICTYVTSNLGTRSWFGAHQTFNGAQSPMATIMKLPKTLDPNKRKIFSQKLTHYRTHNDLVSMSPSAIGTTKHYKPIKNIGPKAEILRAPIKIEKLKLWNWT